MNIHMTGVGMVALNPANEPYINCHQFAREVILTMNGMGYNLAGATPEFLDVLNHANNPQEFGAAYGMLLPNANPFLKSTLATLHDIGLVLFYSTGPVPVLQHTMIARASNTWIGANNTNSLGIDSSTEFPGTGIREYAGIQNRTYSDAQLRGGWEGNVMHSVQPNTYYNMMFVRFL